MSGVFEDWLANTLKVLNISADFANKVSLNLVVVDGFARYVSLQVVRKREVPIYVRASVHSLH